MNETEIRFDNGICVRRVHRVSIILKEVYGRSAGSTITKWDITQFIQKEFPGSIISIDIAFDDAIQIIFSTYSENTLSIIQTIDNKRYGINGKTFSIHAEQLNVTPLQTDWESYFGVHNEEEFCGLPVGKRPDTVIVSNLPGRWFEMDVMSSDRTITPSLQLISFFKTFGDIQELSVTDKTEDLSITVNICFKTYSGFCSCIRGLQDKAISKDGIVKQFPIYVDFDHSGYFSEEAKQHRRIQRFNEKQRRLQEEQQREKEAAEIRDISSRIESIRLEIHSLLDSTTNPFLSEVELTEYQAKLASLQDVEVKRLEAYTNKLHAMVDLKKSIEKAKQNAIHKHHKESIRSIQHKTQEIMELLQQYQYDGEWKQQGSVLEINAIHWMNESELGCRSFCETVSAMRSKDILKQVDLLTQQCEEYHTTILSLIESKVCVLRMEQQLKQVDEMFTQWKGSEYEQCISGWVKSIYQDSHEGIIKSVDSKNIRECEKNQLQSIQSFNQYLQCIQDYEQCYHMFQSFRSQSLHTIHSLKGDYFSNLLLLLPHSEQSASSSSPLIHSLSETILSPLLQSWESQLDKTHTNIIECELYTIPDSLPVQLNDLKERSTTADLLTRFLHIGKQYNQYCIDYDSLNARIAKCKQRSDACEGILQSISNFLSYNPTLKLIVSDIPSISPLEVAPLSRLTEGIKNGVQFFRTKWDQPNIGETCQTYFKRIQEEIDKQVNELKGLKKYCKSIEKKDYIIFFSQNTLSLEKIEEKRKIIETLQQDVIERVIFLRNRKKCIENELLLLSNRRYGPELISSYATHEHQIRSEVHTTECTDHWKPVSNDQSIEEFYSSEISHRQDTKNRSGHDRGGEPAAKRRYVYNSQTKHFDVILET